jgi:hypothetical protein
VTLDYVDAFAFMPVNLALLLDVYQSGEENVPHLFGMKTTIEPPDEPPFDEPGIKEVIMGNDEGPLYTVECVRCGITLIETLYARKARLARLTHGMWHVWMTEFEPISVNHHHWLYFDFMRSLSDEMRAYEKLRNQFMPDEALSRNDVIQ